MAKSTVAKVIAANKCKQRDAKRQKLLEQIKQSGLPNKAIHDLLLPQHDKPLTATQVHELQRNNALSAVDTVKVYSLRALISGTLTNCVTEEFYDEALERAAQIDANIEKATEKSGSPPLLLGTLISVKDHFHQRGADTTMGCAIRCFKPEDRDGLLVELLRDAGAIPFVRTNVPQALLLPESANAIWGVCKNPYNLDRTSGGSTGGGGALLACHASIIEVGSDIGGSIRIPAAMSGVFGLKPTPGRISSQGMGVPRAQDANGQIAVIPAPGPLAHCVEDLVLVMKAWLVDKMFDSDCTIPRTPFDISVYNDKSKRLKIGYYINDGWFDSCLTSQRAVREVVDALKAAGHEVVEWQPPNVKKAVQIYYGLLSADGGKGLRDGLEGEDPHPYYRTLFRMAKLPSVVRSLIIKLLKAKGEERAFTLMSATRPKTAHEYWEYTANMKSYIKTYWESWGDLDVVIAPGQALPPYRHGQSTDLQLSCSVTFLNNLVPSAVGACPITVVREDEQVYADDWNDRYTVLAKETVKDSVGLPCGIQVIGKPWKDEVVLRVMAEIQQLCPFKHRSPLSQQIDIYKQ